MHITDEARLREIVGEPAAGNEDSRIVSRHPPQPAGKAQDGDPVGQRLRL